MKGSCAKMLLFIKMPLARAEPVPKTVCRNVIMPEDMMKRGENHECRKETFDYK